MSRTLHVPYVLEQDEDGIWCASAQFRPGVGAVGDGSTPEAAIEDLREALIALVEEVGQPPELTAEQWADLANSPALDSPSGASTGQLAPCRSR